MIDVVVGIIGVPGVDDNLVPDVTIRLVIQGLIMKIQQIQTMVQRFCGRH